MDSAKVFLSVVAACKLWSRRLATVCKKQSKPVEPGKSVAAKSVSWAWTLVVQGQSTLAEVEAAQIQSLAPRMRCHANAVDRQLQLSPQLMGMRIVLYVCLPSLLAITQS